MTLNRVCKMSGQAHLDWEIRFEDEVKLAAPRRIDHNRESIERYWKHNCGCLLSSRFDPGVSACAKILITPIEISPPAAGE